MKHDRSEYPFAPWFYLSRCIRGWALFGRRPFPDRRALPARQSAVTLQSMTFRRNEAPVIIRSNAVRSRSFFRFGGLLLLGAALPLTLVACAGGDDAAGTGGTSGAGGTTGGTGGAGGATGGTGGAAGSGGALPPLYKGFTFEIVEETSGVMPFTRFAGAVFDAPYPPSFPLTLDTTDGDCKLYVPTNPSCPAGCSGGICLEDDLCSPFPTEASAGTLTVTGLDGGEFMVSPVTTRFVYQAPSALPNPPCTEGGDVSVTGTGFGITTKCIKPLTLTSTVPIPVMTGEPVALAWEPPGQEGISRINVKLDIAHHGGRRGEIQCDVADTGSFSIPAALVTKLVALGLAGFPTIGVKRITTATSTEQPGLSLVMASPLERAVDTGVQSCLETTDCDDGETCTEAKLCE